MGSRPRAPIPAAFEDPGGWLLATTSPFGWPRHDAFHRARPAVAAVGLERRPPDGSDRLPSDIGHEPCGPCGLDLACCSRAWSRPAPCRSPRAMPPSRTEAPSSGAACLVKGLRGRLELPRLRLILAPFPARRPREARERCVSPTSATDSVHEHLRIARFLAALPLRPTPFDA